LEKKLIIELDGGQHADNLAYDNRRTDYLESLGYAVIRIPNIFVMKELETVVFNLRRVLSGEIAANDYFDSRYKMPTGRA
jgi:very-short-patch-repair endonuclease